VSLKTLRAAHARQETSTTITEIWYILEGTEYEHGDLKLTPAEFKNYQASRR
jgi:hypothetical protein